MTASLPRRSGHKGSEEILESGRRGARHRSSYWSVESAQARPRSPSPLADSCKTEHVVVSRVGPGARVCAAAPPRWQYSGIAEMPGRVGRSGISDFGGLGAPAGALPSTSVPRGGSRAALLPLAGAVNFFGDELRPIDGRGKITCAERRRATPDALVEGRGRAARGASASLSPAQGLARLGAAGTIRSGGSCAGIGRYLRKGGSSPSARED